MSVLQVGVIGANAQSGWARESHVPAVQALAGFQLAAVATSTRETAAAARDAFGVRAYDDGFELCKDPGIDVVTVATRVPDHRGLVLAALANGKHVYCEWPLSKGGVEAQELATAAKAAGRHVAIGLQLRGSPAVQLARRLLAEGAIGRPLGINVFSSTAGFGPAVPDSYLYLEQPENFANLVTIQGAHTLDLALQLVGDISSFSAMASRQFPQIEAGGAKALRPRETFDHLLLQGVTEHGATVAVEVAGGRPPETPFRLEIAGEKGSMSLLGGAPRGFQSGRLQLLVNGQAQHVDEGELAGLASAAVNVGGIYAALRDDIGAATSRVAGFEEALRLTHRVESVLESSSTGRRITALT